MISMLEQLLEGIPLSSAATVTFIIVGILCALFAVLLFVEAARSIGAIGLSLVGVDLYFYFTGGLYLYPLVEDLIASLTASLGSVLPWIIVAGVVAVLFLLLLFKFTAYFVCIPLGLLSIDAATLINTAVAEGEMSVIVAALCYALMVFVLSFAFTINYVMPNSTPLETTSRPFGKDYFIARVLSLLFRSAFVFALMLVLLGLDIGIDLGFVGYIIVGVIPIVAASIFICRLFSYADETADICYRFGRRINRIFTSIDIVIYTIILRIGIIIWTPFKWLFIGIWLIIKYIFIGIFWIVKTILRVLWWTVKLIGRLLFVILKVLWKLKYLILIAAIAAFIYFLATGAITF